MTSYRLMDGVAGRPGNGPGTANTYSGNMVTGIKFTVLQGGCWFEGYWIWCCTNNMANTPVKCALWSYSATVGASEYATQIPGTVVTSPFLNTSAGPGAWTYVPIPAPVQLAVGDTLVAAFGINQNFPETKPYFAGAGPYPNGITNGPLYAFSGAGSGTLPIRTGFNRWNGAFNTAGSDPQVTLPITDDNSANFWVDVQIRDTAPIGYVGTWRLHPNMAGGFGNNNVIDTADNFDLATEFSMTAPGLTLTGVWFYSMGPPLYTGAQAATQLPTQVEIWQIAHPDTTGTILVQNNSPTWSGAAGSGWVRTPITNILMPVGSYKVAVYNGASTPTPWNSSYQNFWTGAGNAYMSPGLNGIANGPLFAPTTSAAHNCYAYTSSPPYYNSSVVLPGQSSFFQGTGSFPTPDGYPNIYVTGNYHYLVDVEVTGPLPTINLTANAALSQSYVAQAGLAANVFYPNYATATSLCYGTLINTSAETAGDATIASLNAYYINGSTLNVTATFVDDRTKAAVDPSVVVFKYNGYNRFTQQQAFPTALPNTLLYAGSSTPGVGYVFKNATGSYSLFIDTTPYQGYMSLEALGQGTGQSAVSGGIVVYPPPA